MAFSIKQQTTSTADASYIATLTLTGVVAGNLIVVGLGNNQGFLTGATCSDGTANAYTKVAAFGVNYSGTPGGAWAGYCIPTVGGNLTLSVNNSSGGSTFSAYAYEIQGGTLAYDTYVAPASNTASSNATLTTATDHEVAYSIACGAGVYTGSIPSGFTALQAASGNWRDGWNADMGLAGSHTISSARYTGTIVMAFKQVASVSKPHLLGCLGCGV